MLGNPCPASHPLPGRILPFETMTRFALFPPLPSGRMTRMAVAAAGLVISLLEVGSLWRLEQAHIQTSFDLDAAGRSAAVQTVIDRNLSLLDAIAALYAASNEVERAEVQAFTRGPLAAYPEIQALAWAPRVPVAARFRIEEGA